MKNSVNVCLFTLLFVLFSIIGNHVGHGQAAEVYVIEITNEIDMGLAAFVERGLKEAQIGGADTVIISIDTFGGLISAATRIRDAIFSSATPVITFVEGRAWSAGALIALAGDHLIMMPGASIGGAEPIPNTEKNISALRAEFKATAEKRGKDPTIAMAMVDKDIHIEGVVENGKLLTLSAQDATKHGISDGTSSSLKEALLIKGIKDPKITFIKPNALEYFARAVTNSLLSGLLLTIGFVGLFIEVTTPGWGVPGTIGILSLAGFFSGHLLAGSGSISIAILFFVGLFLLALEIFFIPGFGITGIGGLLAIIASLFLTFPSFDIAIRVVSGSLLATIVAAVLVLKYLPRSPMWQKIALPFKEDSEKFKESSLENQMLVGKTGKTLTVLRPVGAVEIDGKRYDAISESTYLEKGISVRVNKVEGNKIIVEIS